jgi:hypothetical protein
MDMEVRSRWGGGRDGWNLLRIYLCEEIGEPKEAGKGIFLVSHGSVGACNTSQYSE